MSQKWSQLKCTSTLVSRVASLAFVSFFSINLAKGHSTPLNAIEKKYRTFKTLSATFRQETENALLSKKKISTGKLYYLRNTRKKRLQVRWETLTPESQLLIGDGLFFWFYTPPFEPGEQGQVIKKKASDAQTQWIHALLSGDFSLMKNAKIQTKGPSSFVLIPSPKEKIPITEIFIEIDPQKHWIQTLHISHTGGNQSHIFLSEIHLGATLPANLFVFKKPPNTLELH